MKGLFVALYLLLLAGCSITQGNLTPGVLHNTEILNDTTWSGKITIDGQVKVYKSATLTIAPGTEIAFIRRDDDKDGLGDGVLIIEGRLMAIGTPQAPIRFHSAAKNPAPGDWLEIRVDFSRETTLRYCEIRDSAHSLHAHFTKAVVEDSHIHHNNDGSRLGQGDFTLRRNLIEENEGKGINFRNSTIEISNNIIRHNGSGIFLFETDRNPLIYDNNFYDNGENLRLGDFFHRDIEIGSNWWGSNDPTIVAAAIYDFQRDSTLGRVSVEISPEWIKESGPQHPLQLRQRLMIATEGFIDSPPVVLDEDLLIASWDGSIRRIHKEGGILWKKTFNDVIDAPLLVTGKQVCGQNWGREVFCLNGKNGELLWSRTYPPSPSDDHRQGGLAEAGDLLLVPAWNGSLYALDLLSGQEVWTFQGQAPLRATPILADGRIYLSGGDGTLWALDSAGKLLWEYRSPAPLLTPAVKIDKGVAIIDRQGQVTALDRDGKQLWTKELGETCYYAAPLVADDGLYIATAAGTLWKLDPSSGEEIWHRDGFGPIYSTPLAHPPRLLVVGDNTGILTIISAISGDILASFNIGAPIQGGPTSFLGEIALGSRSQKFHLLKIEEGGTD